ncbi:MAG: hypothetical protein JNL10_04850 [Verrucomicrobiales bacterium]|nr:hypothetical protein [Verrucomicrobiales bacterium]
MSDPAASFICAVKGTMARHQCSWTDAWNRTRALQPDLYERLMTANSSRIVQLANANDAVQKRQEAQARLIEAVHKTMQLRGISYDAAWNAVRATEVELYNSAVGEGQTATGGGGDVQGSPSAPPVWGPQNLASLALPAETPADVAAIAWSANGFQVSLVRPSEVWAAVVAYFKALNTSNAEGYCQKRFPQLYQRMSATKG